MISDFVQIKPLPRGMHTREQQKKLLKEAFPDKRFLHAQKVTPTRIDPICNHYLRDVEEVLFLTGGRYELSVQDIFKTRATAGPSPLPSCMVLIGPEVGHQLGILAQGDVYRWTTEKLVDYQTSLETREKQNSFTYPSKSTPREPTGMP